LLGGISSSFLFGTRLYPGIPNSAIQDAVTLEWAGEVLEAKAGVGSTSEGYLYLQLDASGRGFIPLPVSNVEAATYRFLVIDTDGGRHLKGTALIWQTTEAISPVFKQPKPSLSPMRQAGLPLNGWMGAWLDLSAQPHWTGTVANLGLALAGEPGKMVRIDKVSLLPDSLGSQFTWLLASWASHAPWSQRSINFYKGEAGHPPFETVTVYRGGENQVSQALRVPIVLAFIAGSLATYVSLVRMWRSRVAFDWRVAGALFLIAWLALDVPWQWQLWNQLGDTRAAFAGKSAHEKALVAEDAAIYRLIEQIEPLLGGPPARVFIASPQEYLGLRAAYRLYPHNPYWARNRRHELPLAAELGSGDFVLALQSKELRFVAESGQLHWSEAQQVPVERMYGNSLGQLYRVR
jgi:hypothetical protein